MEGPHVYIIDASPENTMESDRVYTVSFSTTQAAYKLEIRSPRQGPFRIRDIRVGFKSTIGTRRMERESGGRRKNCAISFAPFKKFTKHRFYNTMYLSSDRSEDDDAKFRVFMQFKRINPKLDDPKRDYSSILVVRILKDSGQREVPNCASKVYHLDLQTGDIKAK